MRQYELMMILNPELGEEDQKALLSEIRTEVQETGAKIDSEDVWGIRDLAYKINNSRTGFYILFNLSKESGDFFELTKTFNIKKDIWRHMFVRTDDN